MLALVALLALIGLATIVAGVFLWTDWQLRGARRAVALGHNAEAIRRLRVVRRFRPDEPDVLLLSARVARRSGGWNEAELLLDRYSQLHGDDDALTLERLLLKATRGELAAAGPLLQLRIDRHDPAAPLAREALAAGLIYRFRLPEASELIDHWREQEPDSTLALLSAGKLHEQREQNTEAREDYRRLLTIDPQHDEARLRLTTLLLQLSQGEEAADHLALLRRHLPGHAEVLVQLARALDLQGKGDEARAALDQCLQLRPDDPSALAERGRIANRDGDSKLAEELLARATALDPGDARARYQYYLALSANGKTDEALKEQQQVRRIEADIQRLKELLGQLQWRPNDPDANYEVAMIALRAGRPKETLRWLLNALEAGPNHGPTHRALAAYYQETGNPILAARHRAMAQQLSGEAK
ncbi:MAG: tetratricopeptide repeat protein [Gemmataceae bacterium]